ncbi:hypothetical protein P167DRAFT_352677 [Morchella conica CCBAS932]|uniref:Uncharacterized protein n=1 Tax=Morchella conica CCBAS932 TaxID=1392247 RepID=A0A3N4L3Q3_9PEZI|nr:hypothetical protein P167DRAFT_352677 [Morchella conica CCBAS932]
MGITVKSRKHNKESSTSTSDLKLPARPAKSRSKSPSAKATSTSTKLIRPDSFTGLSKLPREAASKPAPSPSSSTTSLTTTTDFSDQHAFRALPGFQWQRNAYGLIDCFADCDKKSYGYGGFKKRRNFLVHLREIHGQDIGSYDRRGTRGWKGTQRKQTMKDIGEMAEAGARTGEDTDYGMESDGLLEPPIQPRARRDPRGEAETKECPLTRNTKEEAVLEQDSPDDIDRDEEMEYGYHDWPEDEIQFEPYHLSHFDLFGVWLERKMGTQLDWWPLRPPVHPDTSGLTRMSWKCVEMRIHTLKRDPHRHRRELPASPVFIRRQKRAGWSRHLPH